MPDHKHRGIAYRIRLMWQANPAAVLSCLADLILLAGLNTIIIIDAITGHYILVAISATIAASLLRAAVPRLRLDATAPVPLRRELLKACTTIADGRAWDASGKVLAARRFRNATGLQVIDANDLDDLDGTGQVITTMYLMYRGSTTVLRHVRAGTWRAEPGGRLHPVDGDGWRGTLRRHREWGKYLKVAGSGVATPGEAEIRDLITMIAAAEPAVRGGEGGE